MKRFDFEQDPIGAYQEVVRQSDRRVLKKPIVHGAYLLTDETVFVTGSGEQIGKAGDYVIVGRDHAWPVSASYFDEHYEVLE
jgi:hypothetical protein